ncbi:tryptophan--tRNA ligase [bacterium]|nr:tryptophan--tRNA ligase [bacterium]
MKQTVFSGIQPTGEIHIGNYLGAIKNWVELQGKYDCIFSIVDYHAITVDYNPKELQQRIFDTAVALLACGINPKKSILFVQSHVPEHTELAWIFNCLIPITELQRMTQFKEKARQYQKKVNAGLLTYPVLQAADILLYKAEKVPVGEDQKQHVELARKIARKFNNKFGNYFPEPESIISEALRIMSLTNPTKKMSKSHGPKSYIALTDSPENVRQKIAGAVTDSGPSKEMSPGVKNLFDLLNYISTKDVIDEFEKQYQVGTLKYADLKQTLTNEIIKLLKSVQKKRAQLIKKPDQVWEILENGAKQAQKIAKKNIGEIRKMVGVR